jgi:hypothetical protein
VRFFVGLDLGQINDYTAVAVLEDSGIKVDGERVLHLRHLERFRHLLYPDVADHVESLLEREPLKGSADLVIDATGVGPAVTDIFKKRGRPFKAVKIHSGDTETRGEDGSRRVPKRNLVSALQVLLQSGRLRIAQGLELAPTLREELLNFRVKVNISTAHDTYEAWREGDHDDLVFAAALAAWGASRAVGASVPILVGRKTSYWRRI